MLRRSAKAFLSLSSPARWYSRPIWAVLEADFRLLLVNARHVMQVSGCDTDMRGCEWLAQLLECGLLKESLVPSANPRAKPLLRARGAERPQIGASAVTAPSFGERRGYSGPGAGAPDSAPQPGAPAPVDAQPPAHCAGTVSRRLIDAIPLDRPCRSWMIMIISCNSVYNS